MSPAMSPQPAPEPAPSPPPRLGWLGRLLSSLYALRVPLTTLAIVGGFGPFAIGNAMFRGFLDLEIGGSFLVSYAAFLAVATAMTVANLVLVYGSLRLHGRKEPVGAALPEPGRRPLVVSVLGLIPYAAMMWYIGQGSEIALLDQTLAVGGGFLLGIVTVIVATALQALAERPAYAKAGVVHLVLPLQYLPLLRGLIEAFYQWQPPRVEWLRSLVRVVTTPFRWLMARTGEGFYDFTPDGKPGRLLPGHQFALSLFFACLVVYLAMGSMHLGELTSPGPMDRWDMPALAYVLVLVMLGGWAFGAMAFYFDRYRVPIIALVFLFLVAGSQFRESDHIYLTFPVPAGVTRPKPAQVLEGRDKAILVAAAGGGIQAAGWTAKVLEGLSAESAEFQRNVRLISSVSGGSVGAMFYLTQYDAVRPPGTAAPLTPFGGATSSYIEPIAWGLMHPDLRRTLIPWSFRNYVDRGWALERALAKKSQLGGVRLSSLVEAIPHGAPALLVNATQVTAGSPMVFSTTTFEHTARSGPLIQLLIRPFYEFLGRHEVELATAVRLSATFPYVSPAARAWHDGQRLAGDHVVDGGYYDNFGMASLMGWLEQAIEGREQKPNPQKMKVLVLQIVSFPLDPAGHPGARSWVYQLAAPLMALFNAREEGQQQRNASQFRLMLERWKDDPRIELASVTFRYRANTPGCAKDPPLSWHLMEGEKKCLVEEWDHPSQRGCRDQVRGFLAKGEMPAGTGLCAQ